jgi:peptidoglycan-associated lipoprotein
MVLTNSLRTLKIGSLFIKQLKFHNMKKILALILLVTISSCGGKLLKDDAASQSSEYQIPQTTEEFDVVDSEAAAAEINQATQAQIEEVQVEDRVLFDLNSFGLTAEASKILDNQSAWLKSDPTVKVIIEGHCDERGTREYNLALGEKRANSVKQYLITNGVESNRIKTISYGKERPAFVGSGDEIWAKNRRAVTVIEE